MIRNPSLRRRLLLFVSIPLLAVLVCGGIINYVIGLHYANKVYDRWLLDSAEAMGDYLRNLPHEANSGDVYAILTG